MDKNLMTRRFAKSAQSYNQRAEAQLQVARRMIQLLQPYIKKGVGKVVEIGCGTGLLSRMLIDTFVPRKLIMNDISKEMEKHCADILINSNNFFVAIDAEQWVLPTGIDLLTSCSTFQWFHQLGGFFEKAFVSLKNDGLFAFSIFGQNNVHEISSITGKSLHYFTLFELSEMLKKEGFSILCAKEEKIVLLFDTPKDVLSHLKQTGVNSITKQKWTKSTLQNFSEQYIEHFSCKNGQVSLTYHPMYLICRKV